MFWIIFVNFIFGANITDWFDNRDRMIKSSALVFKINLSYHFEKHQIFVHEKSLRNFKIKNVFWLNLRIPRGIFSLQNHFLEN